MRRDRRFEAVGAVHRPRGRGHVLPQSSIRRAGTDRSEGASAGVRAKLPGRPGLRPRTPRDP